MNIFLDLSYLDPANSSSTDNATLFQCPIEFPFASLDPSSFNAAAKVSTLLAITINFLTMPFTVIFNSLIIFVVWKNPSLQIERVIVLAYLALADLLVGLICQPLFVARAILQLKKNSTNCDMNIAYFSSIYILMTVSFNQLVLVSYERYVAIIHPFQYPTRITVKRLTYVTIAVWALNTSVVILYFVILYVRVPVLLMETFGSIVYIITIVLMVYWYVRIFAAIRRQNRSVGQQQQSANISNLHNRQQNHKGAVTAAVLLACFLVPLIPLTVIYFLKEWLVGFVSFSDSAFFLLRPWGWTFLQLGCFVNPIVYGLRVGELREKCLHSLRFNSEIILE